MLTVNHAQSSERRAKIKDIATVLGLLLCIALAVGGMAIADRADSISALRVFGTSQAQRVALVMGSQLSVFDAAGQLIRQQDLKTLGIQTTPNDMDWTEHSGKTEA